MVSLVLKHNFIQNKKNLAKPHTVLLPDLNKKFQNLLISPKTDQEANFLNLENRSFECITFCQ